MKSTNMIVPPVGVWTNVSRATDSLVLLTDEEAAARLTAQTSTSHKGQARLQHAR